MVEEDAQTKSTVINITQIIFMIIFIAIIIAQYFIKDAVIKEIPLTIIIFIGGIAAGIKEVPDLISKAKKK